MIISFEIDSSATDEPISDSESKDSIVNGATANFQEITSPDESETISPQPNKTEEQPRFMADTNQTVFENADVGSGYLLFSKTMMIISCSLLALLIICIGYIFCNSRRALKLKTWLTDGRLIGFEHFIKTSPGDVRGGFICQP